MLKWLKQKPLATDDGGNSSESWTTDDPLAMIQQVQSTITPQKAFTKSPNPNEVYTVSRVNPLFEDDVPSPLSPGIHSGSSGYDSSPSDDESPHRSGSDPTPDMSPGHPPESVISPLPILNVVTRNPSLVKSISVALHPPKATPVLHPSGKTKPLLKIGRWKSIAAIQVPIRNIEAAKNPGDKIGAARLIQQSSNYVQSIRIVPSPGAKSSTDFVKREVKECSNREGAPALGRKPSVTFSEQVEVLSAIGPPNSRRSSSNDQDSIVTDSLLLMTSSRRNSDIPLTIFDSDADGLENDAVKRRHDDGLTSFSDSLSRNRIVKQVMTRSNTSLETGSDQTEIDGTTYIRPRHSKLTSNKSSFGGIADHYAAAKEIAKEIESYTQGTTKSSRISMVKDVLLSSRGRSGVGVPTPSVSSPSWASGYGVIGVDGHSPPLVTTVVHLKSLPSASSTAEPSRGDPLEEITRVQPQVYVKANGFHATTTASGPSTSFGYHSNHSKSQPQPTSPFKYVFKRNLDDSNYRQNEGQVQVPIYEDLPPGAPSHISSHSHDDSDSGNSTDRNPNQDHSGDEAPKVPKAIMPIPDPVLQRKPSDIPKKPPALSNDKVMIVSGNSGNLVVDLSGVPPDLRQGLITGSTFVGIPDDLNHRLEPGYAMIAIPQDHDYEILPSPRPHSNNYKVSELRDNNFGSNNITQVWNTMQVKGKGKQRITTGLPHHPNPDSHTTADFTIEGQPLARQTKRVKRLKTRRCCCRIVGIFIFLIAFLGVIVTLSLVYTKGKHYFGPV